MQFLINIAIWSYVAWFSTCNLTDMEWDTLLPDMVSLCPSVDICGKTDLGITNVSGEANPCCLGCSCDESCHDDTNCCFGDENPQTNKASVACLKPTTTQDLNVGIYKFMTGPPLDGCKVQNNQSTCSSDVTVAPWGNFFPVYSKSLDMNFKNEPCALCHGADITDIEHWTSSVTHTGASTPSFFSELTGFYDTYNSSHLTIAFEPLNSQSSSKDKRCYVMIDKCLLTRSFYIPSIVQLDEHAIMNACTLGPGAMHIFNETHAFKNIYCAICSGLGVPRTDSIQCSHSGDSFRSLQSSFTALFDARFLQTNPKYNKEQDSCYRQGYKSNGSRCVQPHCPALQARLPSGKCDYLAGDVKIQCVRVFLNLSTANIIDKSSILSMTKARLVALFQAKNPWSGVWMINSIMLEAVTSRTEFHLDMVLNTNRRFDMRRLTNDIQKRLSKRWSLLVDEEVHFMQRFLTRVPDYRKQVYRATSGSKRFCPDINQLFFCQQIELQPSEYMLEDEELFLLDNNKTLYQWEFMKVTANNGSTKVRVCLEDSGYVRVESATNASHVCCGQIYVAHLLVMLSAIAFM